MSKWINMLFYQATWVSAVASAGNRYWWPGLLVMLAFAAWQLPSSDWPRADAALMGALGVLGFGIDSAFQALGLMHFAAPEGWPDVAPPWMVALWTSFALSLNHSLAFLQGRPLLAAALGCLGAPAAYWAAGRGWHAVAFGEPALPCLALIALLWLLLMPLAACLALRLRRFDVDSSAAAGGRA